MISQSRAISSQRPKCATLVQREPTHMRPSVTDGLIMDYIFEKQKLRNHLLGSVTCYVLERRAFTRLIGNLTEAKNEKDREISTDKPRRVINPLVKRSKEPFRNKIIKKLYTEHPPITFRTPHKLPFFRSRKTSYGRMNCNRKSVNRLQDMSIYGAIGCILIPV